ncbi:MAG: protein translocase subunit SecD, partial [Gemmatimonadaceae bacterium]
DDPERAQEVVQQSAFLQFQITDKTQALERALPRLDAAVAAAGAAVAPASPSASDTGRRAPTVIGGLLSADTSAVAATDSARADTAVAPTGGQFSRLIQQGQMPGEYFVSEDDVAALESYLAMPQVRAAIPPGKEILFGSDTSQIANQQYRAIYVVDQRPIITGEYLTDAKPNTSPTEGTIVEFEFNNEGGRRFRSETSKHIQDYMAIVLDDRVMGRPPIIQSAIGTRGQITMGGRNLQAASDLALVLRAGSLPTPLKIAEVRQIGASLGQDSVSKGITAGLLAVLLVVGIMLVYYRFSGFLSVMGLMLFSLFTLAILAGFGAVLTLPGLAGFVLSLGIAVDANVLIFERIREELNNGKTVRTAVDEGFRHAMSAIVDSNVSTALTAAVLYQYGTGPVQGFAVTLLAGIAASMVSAIFIVRTFYMIWLSRRQTTTTLSI